MNFINFDKPDQITWTNEQKADMNWLWRHMLVTKTLTTKHIAGRIPEAIGSIRASQTTP